MDLFFKRPMRDVVSQLIFKIITDELLFWSSSVFLIS